MKQKIEFKEEVNAFEVEFEGFQYGGGSIDYELYNGVCEITPLEEQQVLHTANKIMAKDVLVHAIPKEYGRITYNQDKIIKIT